MKRYLQLVLVLLASTACACEKAESDLDVLLPANLQVNVEQEEGKGAITLNLSAENTNYYKVDFGDGTPEEKVNASPVRHTYSSSGDYTISIQAHATETAYISTTEEVSISLENVGEPVDGIPTSGYTTPESYAGMQLVWQDEFEGTTLDESAWVFETGTGSGGWGNNELQYYRKENTSLQDGYLIITAKKEEFGGQPYTSSRIKTQGKKSFQYGRVDIRAALPEGQGIWPALWMLGEDITSVGWPACGEIDIMEMIGGSGRENEVHGTVHWQNEGAHAYYGKPYSLSNGSFQNEFHVFSIEWTAKEIKWYVDDQLFNTVDITPAELSEFQDDFFFIFNVAVGGQWPGYPDETSTYPQRMVVDYIRVFQQN